MRLPITQHPTPALNGSNASGDTSVNHGKPEKPQRPDNSGQGSGGPSSAMKDIVTEFRSKAADLKQQRQDLVKQLKDASADDRAKIREQLQANRDAMGQLKDQFRDDVKALHDSLDNAKADSEAASEAKANGKGRRPRN